jgi:hypothetical protein
LSQLGHSSWHEAYQLANLGVKGQGKRDE